MNLDMLHSSKWLGRLEKIFFAFSLWFLLNVFFAAGAVFYELVKVSAQASGRDPFINTQWWAVGNAVLNGLAYAGFTYAISNILRHLNGMKPRFDFNNQKLFIMTCVLFVVSNLFQFGSTIYYSLLYEYGIGGQSHPLWMKAYMFFTSLVPITFDLALAVAFYVFYFQYMRLKTFEEEVI